MTGRELLEQAKKHFAILYVNNEADALDHLVLQALGDYQDKAGFLATVKTVDNEIAVNIPDKFLGLVLAHDAEKQYHEVVIDADAGTITIQETAISEKPYTIHYFVNLRDYDLETDQLPPEIIGTLLDYLIALIDIPNTERARRVALATGQQIEVRSDEELLAKKQLLEEAMEEQHAILPASTVW